MAQIKGSSGKTYQPKPPKTEKCLKILAKAKERRLTKYGNIPVKEMSTTTRHLFLKWGHRTDEIKRFLTSKIKRVVSDQTKPIL